MGDGKLVRQELLGTIPFLLNQATTKRVQFVMCITIAPHHPPIMGIQSLMRTSNLLFKCAIRITWWPAYEYSWLSVKSRNRDDVNELSEFSCRHSFRGSGHTTFFVYIFSQGLLVWVSYLAVLSSYNHLKIFQHFKLALSQQRERRWCRSSNNSICYWTIWCDCSGFDQP